MEIEKPTRKKRSTKIHQTQLFQTLLSHDQVNDIKEEDLVNLSQKARVRELYVDPENSEDYVPFEQIPILERQKTLEFFNTEIVEIMRKRNVFDSRFDKIPSLDTRHFHEDMICPYQEFFSSPFKNGLTNIENSEKKPTDALNTKQKKYLEEMSNYKSLQKMIMPKTRKDMQNQFFQFGKFSDDLKKKCGNISFVNITLDNGYLVCCARMDLSLDLIFLCIVLKPQNPIDEKIFGKKYRLHMQEIDPKKMNQIDMLYVKFCKYFYFSCGHDTISSRQSEGEGKGDIEELE